MDKKRNPKLLEEEYDKAMIDKGHIMLGEIERQWHVIESFCEVFDNREQNTLINRMEAIAQKQPQSVLEYDAIKKELNSIQKVMNAFNKEKVKPIKQLLDLIKKTTALGYEKITIERVKELKKLKEIEAIELGLIVVPPKKPVAEPVVEPVKTKTDEAIEMLDALMVKYSQQTELVAELNLVKEKLVA